MASNLAAVFALGEQGSKQLDLQKKKHQKSAATKLGRHIHHLVPAQVHDQVVDAGADEGDDSCLRDGVQVDGRVLAQPGVHDGKPGGEAREN